MNTLRQNTTFLFLLIIIILSALLLQEWLSPIEPLRPTPTPLPLPVVSFADIQAIAEQSILDYLTVVEIPDARIPNEVGQVIGLDKDMARQDMVMLVYSNVKVGFNRQKLSEEDLWVDGTRVQLVLPATEILSIQLDDERTHILHHDEKSLAARHNLNLSGEIRQIVDDAIRQQIIAANSLEQTARQSKLYFETYLHSLGFIDVRVVVQ